MIEITNEIAAVWSVVVGVFWAGISWGVVKFAQRSFEKRMDEVTKWMRNMEKRLNTDEKDYVRVDDCKADREECRQNLAYHEHQLIDKLSELKTFMIAMDAKREDTRKEISTQYNSICTDLAVLKRSVEHGPIRGA